MHSQGRDNARLEDRLTGAALVDALKLYAEATPAGQNPHPASVADLIDDNREGHHKNWLDAASAEALSDRARWEVLRDEHGLLRGAKVKDADESGLRWLPAWLGGASDEPRSETYAVEVTAPPPPPPEPAATAQVLPQPVMPDTPLPQPVVAQKEPSQEPKPAPTLAATDGSAPRVVNAQALDPNAHPSATTPAKPGGPSRILAGLEARQVLRLSGSDADEPVLTPRKVAPPPPPRSAAVGAVGVAKPGGTAASGMATATGGAAASGMASAGATGGTAPVATGTAASPTASAVAAAVAHAAATGPRHPWPTRRAAAHATPNAPGKAPAASGSLTTLATAKPSTLPAKPTVPAATSSAAQPAATAASPGATSPAATSPAATSPATPPVPQSAAPSATPAAASTPATTAPNSSAPTPTAVPMPATATSSSPNSQAAATGMVRRARRNLPAGGPAVTPPTDTSTASGASTGSSGDASAGAAASSAATSTGNAPQGYGNAPGVPSAVPAATTSAGAGAPGSAVPPLAAMPGSLPAGAPPQRVDTVIYEDNQGAPADTPKVDCRAMTGDAAECDAFEDNDAMLYQRCYQSLSERINACLAGEPVPPLITH